MTGRYLVERSDATTSEGDQGEQMHPASLPLHNPARTPVARGLDAEVSEDGARGDLMPSRRRGLGGAGVVVVVVVAVERHGDHQFRLGIGINPWRTATDHSTFPTRGRVTNAFPLRSSTVTPNAAALVALRIISRPAFVSPRLAM